MIRRQASDERGIALITVMLVLAVLTSLVIVTISVAVHTNDATKTDSRKEGAYGAANAGVDKALQCLQQLNPANAVTTCNNLAGSGTQLSDAGTNTGQFEVTVTDLTPGLSTKRVLITSNGWGPTKTSVSASRTNRTLSAEVTLTPVGGFFDTIFAGGTSPNGLITLKNNATVNGTVYAANYDVQKNNNSVTDLQIVGDVTTKNNDVYHSIWSGGSVTISNNTVVQTTAQACGAGASAGNASLSNGSQVVGNLRYKGTYNNGGSVGSLTHAGCSAPPTLGLPAFTYSTANYPGWTIVNFATVALANTCLATASGTLVAQSAACGGSSLGDANGSVGKNAAGTLVYVNAASCLTPVTFSGSSFTGNFTIVTNCKLSVDGTYTKAAGATGNKQIVFVSTSTTGSDDLAGAPTSASGSLSVLLYSTGEVSTKNNLSIAAGAMYGATVNGKNSVSITSAPDLANNPPPGFTFDPAIATTYIPVVTLWQES